MLFLSFAVAGQLPRKDDTDTVCCLFIRLAGWAEVSGGSVDHVQVVVLVEPAMSCDEVKCGTVRHGWRKM
jgi:hypothetical protein